MPKRQLSRTIILCSLLLSGAALLCPTQGAAGDVINTPIDGESVSITAETVNCPAWQLCEAQPEMRFTLVNPENKKNVHMRVQVGGTKHNKENNASVIIQIPVTGQAGLYLKYWAFDPSSGKEYFSRLLIIRNLAPLAVGDKYMLELLGEEWLENAPKSVRMWKMFPATTKANTRWYSMMDHPHDLITEQPFALLAGKLIWTGEVDASECADGGLMPGGGASPCGEEKASVWVRKWQNQHNAEILKASIKAEIPPGILKGVIAQESQFWPDWHVPDEYGLGMLTIQGAGSALQWNDAYFLDQCKKYYSDFYCGQGYWGVLEEGRELMSELALLDVGTEEEYLLLAETLSASRDQADYLVRDLTKIEEIKDLVTYETMWRIALGIYHSGYGCMLNAMRFAYYNTGNLEWGSIAPNLEGHCASAADYFDKVVFYMGD